jgi:hypothetical protein
VSTSSNARLIGTPAATARSQNPFTNVASASPRRPALASQAFNASMSCSATMVIPGIRPLAAFPRNKRMLEVIMSPTIFACM